jgi:hypothetical protein
VKSLLKAVLATLAIGSLSGLFCQPAQAAANPIKGEIDFIGSISFGDNMGNTGVSLASATRVSTWISSIVSRDTLDFSSVPTHTNVTMATPWIFNPSTNTPSLWSVGGFKFDLTSSVVALQNSMFLNVTGLGTASGNGFDSTPGTWSFTSSSPNGQNNGTFSFQSNTAVPESGTVALLATGALLLAGIHFLRSKHKYARIEVKQ